MAKILRNESGGPLDIPDINFFAIADTDSVTLDPRQYDKAAKSALDGDLSTLIPAGDIIVNDGNGDLTSAIGLEYMLGPESAFGQRFLSDPDRINGFSAKDTQEAIEEAKNTGAAAIFPIQIVYNGNLSGDTFLSYSNLTPNTPMIVPVNANFVGFTFSNARTNNDFGLDFRNNTNAGAAFYNISVDNTQSLSQILPSPEAFTAGDFISVEYLDEGGNSNDVVITLFFNVIL